MLTLDAFGRAIAARVIAHHEGAVVAQIIEAPTTDPGIRAELVRLQRGDAVVLQRRWPVAGMMEHRGGRGRR